MKNNFAFSFFLFVLFSSLPNISFCDEFSKDFKIAWKHYKEGDYKKSLPLFKLESERGVPEAMYTLGDFYANGYGVKQDFIKSEYWFVKSANYNRKEKAEEMLNLGMQFYLGDRVNQNYNKAVIWFTKSNKLGNSLAAYFLGIYHLEISKNYQKAIKWFEDAAERNLVESQIMIGGLYGLSKNSLIPRNFNKGRYWCQRAINNKVATDVERKRAQDYLERIAKLESIQ